MKNRTITFLFMLLASSFIGCEKQSNYEGLTGTLLGRVYGYTPSMGINSIVTLEGINPTLNVKPDSNGQFQFDNLRTGTYYLTYQGEGLCSIRTNNFQFLGGEKPVRHHGIGMYELPSYSFENIETEIVNSFYGNYLQYSFEYIDLAEDERYRSYKYYISNKASVSYQDYILNGFGSYSQNTIHLDTTTFPVGSTCYIKFYPAINQHSSYVDLNTGLSIYNCINKEKASEVKSVIVPEIQQY